MEKGVNESMKIKGMIKRKIDNKGRILIPKELTDIIGINGSDLLTIKVIEHNKKTWIKIEKE